MKLSEVNNKHLHCIPLTHEKIQHLAQQKPNMCRVIIYCTRTTNLSGLNYTVFASRERLFTGKRHSLGHPCCLIIKNAPIRPRVLSIQKRDDSFLYSTATGTENEETRGGGGEQLFGFAFSVWPTPASLRRNWGEGEDKRAEEEAEGRINEKGEIYENICIVFLRRSAPGDVCCIIAQKPATFFFSFLLEIEGGWRK